MLDGSRHGSVMAGELVVAANGVSGRPQQILVTSLRPARPAIIHQTSRHQGNFLLNKHSL